jgi:hypothetical protein
MKLACVNSDTFQVLLPDHPPQGHASFFETRKIARTAEGLASLAGDLRALSLRFRIH